MCVSIRIIPNDCYGSESSVGLISNAFRRNRISYYHRTLCTGITQLSCNRNLTYYFRGILCGTAIQRLTIVNFEGADDICCRWKRLCTNRSPCSSNLSWCFKSNHEKLAMFTGLHTLDTNLIVFIFVKHKANMRLNIFYFTLFVVITQRFYEKIDLFFPHLLTVK